MDVILDSIRPVIEQGKSVKINTQAIARFIPTILKSELDGSEYANDTIPKKLTEEENIAFTFLYNTVNFCYWGDPKWTVTVAGQQYDGGAAMIRCLQQAIYQKIPLLDASYLKDLKTKRLDSILNGNVPIPLFQERLELLRELGQVIHGKFNSSFKSFIDEYDWDTEKIVVGLAKDLPKVFNDVSKYFGNTAKFYKRAQLIPTHLHDLYKVGLLSKDIRNTDRLTAFADYKVPQIMRKFGILEYSPSLAEKIDVLSEITKDSPEEIEIRAHTIWANELITREAKKTFPTVTAAQIDSVFWFRGQTKSPEDKPYHRTRTIWY